MGVPVRARPCPWGRASPSRVLLLAALAALRTIAERVREQRETYQEVREHLETLRRFLDDAQSSQGIEQHQGGGT